MSVLTDSVYFIGMIDSDLSLCVYVCESHVFSTQLSYKLSEGTSYAYLNFFVTIKIVLSMYEVLNFYYWLLHWQENECSSLFLHPNVSMRHLSW